MRTGPSLPRGGTLVSSCPPPVSVLTVNLSCALGHSEGARECVRKYCVEYLYGEVWFFLLFSSSKGAPVLVALWDFPVSTDTLSTQIPKQSVPIGLVHSFVWSGPPARLGSGWDQAVEAVASWSEAKSQLTRPLFVSPLKETNHRVLPQVRGIGIHSFYTEAGDQGWKSHKQTVPSAFPP